MAAQAGFEAPPVTATDAVDGAADATDEPAASTGVTALDPRIAGSHIRAPQLTLEGIPISVSPLRTRYSDRASLERGRQMAGIAVPDTTAALGLGESSTIIALRSRLRVQPTLFLLNGRRMVSAPFVDRFGMDFVDLNQLPISLISRVETTSGMAAGLYGDGAIGGVVNFVTHRDYDGIEIDLGGQITDKGDQHQADITLTTGVGDEQTGMNAMVGYFNRQPLAAHDRDWVKDRIERHESITGNPLSYRPLFNFVEYPFVDPGCGVASDAGAATGQELRIPLFGEPMTRAGGNAIELLPTSPLDFQAKYLGRDFDGRGNSNGMLEAGETSTYCGNDLTRYQDLILEEERLQTYTTFWHAFGDHLEGFGELGYYRNENRNRTSPSFPTSRVSPDIAGRGAVLVPETHADIPVESFGFAGAENVPMGSRTPNIFFLVGSPLPLHAGAGMQERRIDTLRGVLGLRGDLQGAAEGTVMETWDWELAGVYSETQSVRRVSDVLLDKLGDALNSCPAEVRDLDSSSPTMGDLVPSTIKQRQEMGCFNPFYSSVVNNVAVDPLGESNGSVPNSAGFITADSETGSGQDGFGLQDGGAICDPAAGDECPESFDPNNDGVPELAGTPNTRQVIDGMTGEHITQERRSLATVDLILGGDVLQFDGGHLAFGLGGQFRRETLSINYDAAYNQRRYAFLFGGPDVDPVGRNIGAGFVETRLRLADGLVELQGAARVEHFEHVGTAFSPLGGVAVRPFANGGVEALEWLLVRGHVGLGHRAPSLLQQFGTYTEFHAIEYDAELHFIPHQVLGNPDLDFEKYTTLSLGVQYDYLGFHVDADAWLTFVDDMIGADNVQTLTRDCDRIDDAQSRECREVRFARPRIFNHVESPFDNLAQVETNGLDGSISYALDTERRGLGELGIFSLGFHARYINSYLIKSPRALREYYRDDEGALPTLRDDGTRDYSELSAEYEAAGYRNLENFAPPMPKLRFAVPLQWFFGGHTLGFTMRYVGAYNDDSESTIEKYGLGEELAGGESAGTIPYEEGEEIPAWTVFDLNYGFAFGNSLMQTEISAGIINLFDAAPPGAESGLGYDIGIHDPRGRMLYARVTGKF